MSISEKISRLYEKSFWDALGCGYNADAAADFAREKVAPLVADLHRIELCQKYPNGIPQRGSRAGRFQRNLRK